MDHPMYNPRLAQPNKKKYGARRATIVALAHIRRTYDVWEGNKKKR